jgi:hypothetical protein
LDNHRIRLQLLGYDTTHWYILIPGRSLIGRCTQKQAQALAGRDSGQCIVELCYVPDPAQSFQLLPATKPDGVLRLNTFSPAKWQKVTEQRGRIPAIFERGLLPFISHLFNNDKQTVSEVYNWVAAILRGRRNINILTLIGQSGIGKNVFGRILQELVGHQNYVLAREDAFNERFNGQLKFKQVIHWDEAHVANIRAYNALKRIANHELEIEEKGKDPERVDNYASVLLTSNDLDAVTPPGDDRRLWIVNLTHESLAKQPFLNGMPVEKFVNEICSESVIRALGNYILNNFEGEVRHSIPQGTAAATTRAEILYGQLKDWERTFLSDFCNHVGSSGSRTVTYHDFQRWYGTHVKRGYAPGAKRIADLASRVSQIHAGAPDVYALPKITYTAPNKENVQATITIEAAQQVGEGATSNLAKVLKIQK